MTDWRDLSGFGIVFIRNILIADGTLVLDVGCSYHLAR